MKKISLLISLIFGAVFAAQAQCPTVSGTVTNVSCNGGANGAITLTVSGDSAGVSNPGLLISELRTDPPLGDSNFEWVELIATDFIDFAVKPYTVIFSNNGTATSKGWVEGQIPSPPPRNSTYAFLINTGTVSPGDVVYVGGSSMEPTGVKLRVKTTTTEAGDGGIGGAFTGASGVLGNGGGVADGIAIFNRHVSQIDSNTVPVDAIFYGTSIGDAAMADTTKGFRLPINDRYSGGRLTLNSFLAPEIFTFYSLQASGTYNRSTGVYSTSRTWSTNTTAWSGSVSSVSVSGNTYVWSNGSTSKDVSGLLPGIYTVIVTNGSGCSVSQTFTIVQSLPISMALLVEGTTCHAASNGSVSAAVSGGNTPYSYLWNTGATTASLTQQAAGTYTLTVTDSKGCTATSSATIASGNSLPQVQLTSGPIICNGASTGSMISAVNGGSAPYTYAWSTGATSSNITQRPAGTYTVTITDAVGCSSSASASIQQAPPLLINSIIPSSNSSGFPVTLKGTNLLGITQVRFGTVSASSFTSSGDTSIQAIVPSDAQSGLVTVTNSNGCTGTSSSSFSYVSSNPELTVRLFIEGLYVGNGYMELPLVNIGLSSNAQHSDSIELSLVSPNDINTIAYKKKTILFSGGHATIALPGWVLSNSYYIVIKHRSSVETWSKLPVSFINENTYFNAGGNSAYASVLTGTASAITNFSAIVSATVQSDGGSAVITRGLCWSTTPKPTISLATKTSNGSDTGSFSGNLTGLLTATKYYVRAYATNSLGTAYGQEVIFTTSDIPVDVDGNTYDTVVIGTQVWMSKNLRVSKYRNGDSIPTNLSNTTWQSTTSGAYAIYNNSSTNDIIYGKLYNWYAVADPRGLCPTGWHVPSDAEWSTLESFLGGSAAGAMKAVSTLWQSPNTGATNSSGFTGLPGGYREDFGSFRKVGNSGYWWTSTQYSSPDAWFRYLYYLYAIVYQNYYNKTYGFSVRCVRDSPPTVTTSSVSGINSTSATCGGNITDSGGDSVSVRGVCWSTSPNPTVALPTKTSNGSGIGSFTSSITGLQPSTTYYVRAYATNGAGTVYGNEVTFTTLAAGQFTDIDGNIYDTVAIGTQVWMSKNLRVSKYRNGDPIPTNLSNTTWLTTTSGAYDIYNNTAANDSIYGKLYNWYAVADTRRLCPTGWHVPSDAEWITLENFLGGSSVAGGKMKAISPLWLSPNTGANNSSGFSGLPSGGRNGNGSFFSIGNDGFLWSSTQFSTTDAWARNLRNNFANLGRTNYSKSLGVSVRCIRDALPNVSTSSVSGINSTSATSGGNITNSGGDSVSVRGVCWSISPNPTVALPTKTSNGSGSGSFTSSITGLQASTTYYVRAYGTNSSGTVYGSQITFTTLATGQFTDIDENIYDTIAIGSQVWMKQNLKVSKYRNGDPIPTGLADATWQATTSGAYAIYNNTAANDSIYGKLYNWYAVADPRGLCPTGWHVPSDAEWTTLENFLGGSSVAGGKMKAVSPLWLSPNTGATNSSGFSGLPGGVRGTDGSYAVIGAHGRWWSSTQGWPTSAWSRLLNYFYASVYRDSISLIAGVSVRCVRD